MIVGLTGGIGSGKSEAAQLFEKLGVPVVDTDAIAHMLTAPGGAALDKIAQRFGAEAITADGSMNRAFMRKIVFSDRSAKQALESILHPMIQAEVQAQLKAHANVPYQIIMVPLLFETVTYTALIDRSLVIDCDEETQVRRVMARSQLSEPEVRAIMDTQCFRDERVGLADDVIDNNGSLENLETQVREKHEKYIRLA